jgi:hypothetical protein
MKEISLSSSSRTVPKFPMGITVPASWNLCAALWVGGGAAQRAEKRRCSAGCCAGGPSRKPRGQTHPRCDSWSPTSAEVSIGRCPHLGAVGHGCLLVDLLVTGRRPRSHLQVQERGLLCPGRHPCGGVAADAGRSLVVAGAAEDRVTSMDGVEDVCRLVRVCSSRTLCLYAE